MTVSKKVKIIDDKIEQSKAQYDLDRQIPKSSAFSSGNVSKHGFLNGLGVLSERKLLEKACTIKKFEYSPVGTEFRKQTSVAEKQYQKLDKVFEPNKKGNNETKNKKSVLSQI